MGSLQEQERGTAAHIWSWFKETGTPLILSRSVWTAWSWRKPAGLAWKKSWRVSSENPDLQSKTTEVFYLGSLPSRPLLTNWSTSGLSSRLPSQLRCYEFIKPVPLPGLLMLDMKASIAEICHTAGVIWWQSYIWIQRPTHFWSSSDNSLHSGSPLRSINL